jgi:hypothetical protein
MALPEGKVETDKDFRLAVFRLARHLKAVAELRDRAASGIKALVRRWQELAAEHLGGRTFVDVYAEFVGAWQAVRHAAGDDAVKLAWDIALTEPLPPAAAGYDDERVGRLIGLCYKLQRENEIILGSGHGFFLSGRVVAKLLRITQPVAANWLKMLVEDGILEVTNPGGGFRGGRRMAREYRVVERPE